MKKIFSILLVVSLLLPVLTQAEEEISSQEMLHFVFEVRWGNVMAEPTYQEKTVYDGSISLGSENGKVSLIKEVLFEKHNEDCDKILTKFPSVSWQSCIYNHWDGVKVLVSGVASDNLTVHTAQGDLIKTVKEFYEMRKPIIKELVNNQEIVVKTFPVKKRSYLLTVFWGGGEEKQKVDFSGSLKIEKGAAVKFIKALRFEEKQGDKITNQTSKEIVWNSYILGGLDGLLTRIALEKEVPQDANLAVNFTSSQVNWQKNFDLINLFHQRIIKETIQTSPTSTKPYTLVLALKRQPNQKLVKVKDKKAIYLVEDEAVRAIPSNDVLKENNLSLKNVETISQEELETYAEGESLTYPDGTLIKGSGKEIYFVSQGKKRLIKAPKTFKKLGLNWKNVKKISDQELKKIENEVPITEKSDLPDGVLVKEKGKKEIYLIEGGRKKLVSGEVLKARGYKLGHIATVEKEMTGKFKSEEALTYPDGTLIKGSGPGIYLIDKGKKRPIKSKEDFESLKLKWKEVKKISDNELKKLPEGDQVIGE